MWFLPTRSRPNSLQRFFDHYVITKATSPGVVWLDDDDINLTLYKSIQLPANWKMVVAPNYNKGTGYITNLFFEMFPNEPFYGLLGDDVIPKTYQWDRKLIETAGNDGLAYGDDGINPSHAAHPCVGGDLVRGLGWLALPGLDRIYIDNALHEVAKRAGKAYFMPNVKTEHLHFSTGKSPFDKTYEKSHNARDKEIYEAWLATLS